MPLTKKNGDYREIETKVSLANIKDQIGALLYATGTVHDNEEIISIDFRLIDDGGDDWDGNYPIQVKIKKQQEVEVIQH